MTFDTPYWRLWFDLVRDVNTGKWPRALRKKLFIWWDSLAERLG